MNNECGHWLNCARHTRSPNEITMEMASEAMLWHIPRVQISQQWLWPLRQSSGTAQKDNNTIVQYESSRYESPTWTMCGYESSVISLKIKFVTFLGTLSKSEPLQPQINTILLAASKVTTLRLPLNDKLVTFAIISPLPPSMGTLKKILSNIKLSNITTENIMSQIALDKQQCMHESGTSACHAWTLRVVISRSICTRIHECDLYLR